MPVWLSLGLQGFSLLLLFVGLRGRFFRHIGAIFILVAVVYHGAAEILNAIDPGANTFRVPFQGGINPLVRDWLGLVSPAILICTLSYLLVLGRTDIPSAASESGRVQSIRFFDWRIVGIIIGPIYIYTVLGHVQPVASSGNTLDYLSSGVTSQFLLLGIVIMSISFISRYGSSYTIPVLILQSIALSFLGQRLNVIAGAVMLFFALARQGSRPSRRVIATALALVVILGWAISSGRALSGRDAFTYGSGGQARAGFLFSGIRSVGSSVTQHQVAVDYVYRLDGNAYPALILNRFRQGEHPAGLTPLKDDILLAIPRFLEPGKLKSATTVRNEQAYLTDYYTLPTVNDGSGNLVPVNYLIGLFGAVYAFVGAWGLLACSILIGIFFAVCDRWLKKKNSPAHLIVALGLLYCALLYEQGFAAYPIVARGVITLALGLGLVGFIRRVVSTPAESPSRPVRPAPAAGPSKSAPTLSS